MMSAKIFSETWGLMIENSDEGPIARGRRRALELGEACLAQAELEAEQLAQDLGRKPTFAEKLLIEQIAYLSVRVRRLRAWGRSREADDTTRLLATILIAFEKKSKPVVKNLLEEQIQ
jgi:hypothetical protein